MGRTLSFLAASWLSIVVMAASRPTLAADEFSPEGAAAFCRSILLGVSIRDGHDPFLSKLPTPDLYADSELVAAFHLTGDTLDAAYWVAGLGDYRLLEMLWPRITRARKTSEGDFEWNMLAQAVACSNEDTGRFLLERGWDPNASRPRTSDMMMTAIANKDLPMARLLFDFGYRCDAALPKDRNLAELADRLQFPAFEALYREHCDPQ